MASSPVSNFWNSDRLSPFRDRSCARALHEELAHLLQRVAVVGNLPSTAERQLNRQRGRAAGARRPPPRALRARPSKRCRSRSFRKWRSDRRAGPGRWRVAHPQEVNELFERPPFSRAIDAFERAKVPARIAILHAHRYSRPRDDSEERIAPSMSRKMSPSDGAGSRPKPRFASGGSSS